MSIAKSCMKIATGESVDGLDDYAPKKKRKSSNSDTRAREDNQETDEIKIHEDKRNYRKHSAKNLSLISKSLTDFGAGRSIVADNSGQVIGGNGTLREANKLGIKQRIIHTNGDELVVVVRDDIAPDDPRRAELAIMDNSTTDSSEFDFDLLNADFAVPELTELGVVVPDVTIEDDFDVKAGSNDDNNIYSKKIEGLIYEPTGEKPKISELYADEKQKKLLKEIEDCSLTAAEKDFLKLAATRHIVFDYHKIAEFYAQAEKPMQELMEKSALVIIDYDSAIQNGFTQLAADIDEMREEDYAAELEEKENGDA